MISFFEAKKKIKEDRLMQNFMLVYQGLSGIECLCESMMQDRDLRDRVRKIKDEVIDLRDAINAKEIKKDV